MKYIAVRITDSEDRKITIIKGNEEAIETAIAFCKKYMSEEYESEESNIEVSYEEEEDESGEKIIIVTDSETDTYLYLEIISFN